MDQLKLIEQWNKGLRIRHICHTKAFTHYKRWDKFIGLLSAMLAAVVATTVFASLSDSDSKSLILIAGCISILATLFAAAHSFLNFSELSERHRNAAASFGELRRDLEATRVGSGASSIEDEKLEQINIKWSELEKQSPSIPQRIYDQAAKDLGHKPAKKEEG